MREGKEQVRNLLFGPMRAEIITAGIKLGVFEVLDTEPCPFREITKHTDIDPEYGYRLLRALAAIGVLSQDSEWNFSVTEAGKYLSEDHPQSLMKYFLLETSQKNKTLWSYLPTLIEEGEQDTFIREYGSPFFEYLESNPEVALWFNEAMQSYSRLHTTELRELLSTLEIPREGHVCDVGGGHGHLLCLILASRPSLTGTVLDRPLIINDENAHLAPDFGVADRCSYVVGNMFNTVPTSDIYLLKHILHDWPDSKAVQILTTIRDHAPSDAQIILIEHILSETTTPQFPSLYDIQMITWTRGRERTSNEYTDLLARSGWTVTEILFTENKRLGAVRATPAE